VSSWYVLEPRRPVGRCRPGGADVTVANPNGRVRFVLHQGESGLTYAVTVGTARALERAPLGSSWTASPCAAASRWWR
jgi:hypothetical protein